MPETAPSTLDAYLDRHRCLRHDDQADPALAHRGRSRQLLRCPTAVPGRVTHHRVAVVWEHCLGGLGGADLEYALQAGGREMPRFCPPTTRLRRITPCVGCVFRGRCFLPSVRSDASRRCTTIAESPTDYLSAERAGEAFWLAKLVKARTIVGELGKQGTVGP
ncbi:MAG: hypothetical protein ACYDHP_08280 [Ferrimicrobium sp.]